MNYYGGKELADAFRTVRKNTIQIAEEIPENKYAFRAAPETRTVAATLVHIAVVSRLFSHVHRNKVTDMKTLDFRAFFEEFGAEENKPRSKAELIALLKSEGDAFASFLETLPEPFLAERVTQTPGTGPATKTRFEMLLSAKEHEMHHRAQLMVVQRMLGQVPHLTRQMQERIAAMTAQAQR
jgi:uncharacterized damage-inducible protein DinB